MMSRVTLRIPRSHLKEIETLVEEGVYPNRSEAMRAAIREFTADQDESQVLTDGSGVVEHDERLDEAANHLLDARASFDDSDRETGAHYLSKSRETLANLIREIDGDDEHAPMWELAQDDVEDYVGCTLADIAFSDLGSAVVLVFERADGSLHGFKLTPREAVRVCDVQPTEESQSKANNT